MKQTPISLSHFSRILPRCISSTKVLKQFCELHDISSWKSEILITLSLFPLMCLVEHLCVFTSSTLVPDKPFK